MNARERFNISRNAEAEKAQAKARTPGRSEGRDESRSGSNPAGRCGKIHPGKRGNHERRSHDGKRRRRHRVRRGRERQAGQAKSFRPKKNSRQEKSSPSGHSGRPRAHGQEYRSAYSRLVLQNIGGLHRRPSDHDQGAIPRLDRSWPLKSSKGWNRSPPAKR